jgi:hypothetical protein
MTSWKRFVLIGLEDTERRSQRDTHGVHFPEVGRRFSQPDYHPGESL